MKVANAEEMRRLDKITIDETGIPGIVLMENAARAVYEKCISFLNFEKKKRVLVVCGGGNNGGDGFAAARLLKNINFEVSIFLLADEEKIKGDAKINLEIIKKYKVPFVKDMDKIEECLENTDLIVDAVLGTGFKGEIRERESFVINKINLSNKYVISIDIASGVNSDNGKVSKTSVLADETVTFALPKVGNILYPGAENCGKLSVADISIPYFNIEKSGIKVNTLTFKEASMLLPKRKNRSNKGSYGKVYVFAGSENMTGAGVFCCKAAYKSGCGLVYANFLPECRNILQSLVPEAVFKPITGSDGMFGKESYKSSEGIENADAVIIGPGIGQGEEVSLFVEEVITKVKSPIVIDADALNVLVNKKEILKNLQKCQGIITPHPGEMGRLMGISVKEVLDDIINIACDFAKEYNVIVVLKDARTIIADPDGNVFVNTTGNNSMSKGGSGDVLCGVIGGLLAQGLNSFHAAALGVYIHGKAGDLAAKKIGSYGVLASELADFIPFAIKEFEEYESNSI